jgi:hypothetical protein
MASHDNSSMFVRPPLGPVNNSSYIEELCWCIRSCQAGAQDASQYLARLGLLSAYMLEPKLQSSRDELTRLANDLRHRAPACASKSPDDDQLDMPCSALLCQS